MTIKNTELVEFYLKKSKCSSYSKEALYCENEHGFMTWTPDNQAGCLFIFDVCGDGEYWDEFAGLLAKYYGFKKIRFATKRSPKAFRRKFGYELLGYILEKEVE